MAAKKSPSKAKASATKTPSKRASTKTASAPVKQASAEAPLEVEAPAKAKKRTDAAPKVTKKAPAKAKKPADEAAAPKATKKAAAKAKKPADEAAAPKAQKKAAAKAKKSADAEAAAPKAPKKAPAKAQKKSAAKKAPAKKPVSGASPKAVQKRFPQPSDVRVLVVDDEPDILELVVPVLEGEGYTVLEAIDGDIALEKILTEHPHVVVLDVMMPGLNGWEVARYVRERPQLSEVRIIMATGIGAETNAATSPLYGADAYLDKPFELKQLRDAVSALVERFESGEFAN